MGQSVRVNDDVRPRQYAGRVGTVVTINEGEIGLNLGSSNSHNERDVVSIDRTNPCGGRTERP